MSTLTLMQSQSNHKQDVLNKLTAKVTQKLKSGGKTEAILKKRIMKNKLTTVRREAKRQQTQFFGENNYKTTNLYPVKSKQRLQIKIIFIYSTYPGVQKTKKKKKQEKLASLYYEAYIILRKENLN